MGSADLTNAQKLQALVCDTFLLEPAQYRADLRRDQVDTWDSLGVVALAVGVQETFGYHLKPEEATGLRGIADLISLLRAKGIEL